MKFLKKCILALLCALLMIPMATGCGKKDDSEITVFYNDLASINTAIKKGTPAYRKYMEDCGVEFRCLTTGGGDSEAQLQRLFNVGELPDIFVHRTAELPKLYSKMIEDSAIIPISDYVSETKYPNIYQQIHKHDYLTSNIDFAGGKHYAIPTEFQQEHTFYVRKDWIENLNKPDKLKTILVDEGYAANASGVTAQMLEEHKFGLPETLLDFYRLARAFTKYDPDGNGKDDTYGYATSGAEGMYSNNWLFVAGGGFRVMQDSDGDGTYTFSGTTDGNKYSVGLLNRMLDEGMISPSWVTDKIEGKHAQFTNGTAGMIESQVQLTRFAGDMSVLTGCTREEAAEKIAMIAPPKGETGLYGVQGHPGFWTSVSLSASMSEEKRERALKMLDYLLSDAGKELMLIGVEGVHYEKTADGKYRSLCGKDQDGYVLSVSKVDSFLGMGVFNGITRGYYNPFIENAAETRIAMDNAQEYNFHADYYMLTTPKYTEYWDGLCDKMINEFTLMIRDGKNVNAAYASQKMKDLDWDNMVLYNDNFNTVWNSYVDTIENSYHGKEIEAEYNAAIADHGVKAVVPDVSVPVYPLADAE